MDIWWLQKSLVYVEAKFHAVSGITVSPSTLGNAAGVTASVPR